MPEPKSNRGGRVWGLYQQGVSDRGRGDEIRDIWEIEEDRRERRKAEESELIGERNNRRASELIGGNRSDRRAQSRFDEDGRTGRSDGDGRTHRSAPTKGDGRTSRASLQRATRGEDVVLQPDVERVPHSPLDPRKKGLELARLSDTPSGVWLGRPWGSSTLDVLSGRGEDKGAKMLQTLAGGDFTFGGRGRGIGGSEWSYRKPVKGGEQDVFGAQMDRIARETERMSGKAFAESRAREDADRRANPISYGLRALSGRYGRDTIDAVAGSSDEEKTLYATNRVLGDYKNDRRLVERVVSGKEGWLSRMGKTFADDMDGGMKLLDFGVEDAVTTRAITMAMAKFEKVGREGLSQAERNLLDAVAVRDTYRAFYETQLGDNWSGAGRVTAEALPFVRDMVLGGGLSGAARGAAGGAAKAGAKEAAKGVVKGAVRRYLGEWLKKAPGQIVGTLAIEMPRVAGGAEERMHGRLVAERLDGDDGGVSATSAGSASSRGRGGDTVGFGGRREGAEKSYGVAFAKSLGDQTIEVVSETLGEPMMKGLGLAGRAVFKPLAKSGVGKAVGGAVSELGAKLGSRPSARAVGRLYTGAKRTLAPMREMTRVGGFAEEFLEEQLGGSANALLIGDQSMKDVWGLSGMEQTAVALLPMQVAFGGVGAVGSTARLVKVNGAVRRSAESLRANGGDVDALQGRLRGCSYVELEGELLSRHTKLEEIVSRLRDESLGVEERLSLEGEARRVGAEMRYVSNWMSREMLVGASEAEIEEARGKLESDLESRRRAVLEDEFANGDVLAHRDDAGNVVDYEIVEVTYGPNDAKGYLVSGAVRDGKVCLDDGSGGAVVVRGADGREQVHSDDVRVARVLGRDAVDQGVQAKVVADMEGRMQAVSEMMDAYEKGVVELSRDDVEGVVRDVMGRLGVDVPWRVMSREEVEAEGGKLDGSERGWYDERSGEVVILSDGVSRKSVEHTVLHEVVGHRGLAALFDRKALYDYFDSVWESMSDRDREEMARLYPGLSSSDLASEYIAHQAETYSNPGVWTRIVAGFRQLLDGLGLSLKVSDGDIRMMLSRGVRAMQEGRESEVSEGIGANRSESEAQESEGIGADRNESERSEGAGGASDNTSGLDGDGRSDRASLQRATREGASVQRATREGSGVGVGSRIRWRDESSGEVRGGEVVGAVDSDLYMVLPDGSDSPVSVGRDLIEGDELVDSSDGESHGGELVDAQGNAVDAEGRLITERVNSIEELTDEDFETPYRSVELPPLPTNVAEAIGSDGKPVVIKKNIFERNRNRHEDLSPEDSRAILLSALYAPSLYGQNQLERRPYNWILIYINDTEGKNRAVLLEVSQSKEQVEIIHWHYLDAKGLEKIERQARREDGQLLILPSESTEEAGALSSPTPSSPTGEGGSVPVSRDGLPAKPGSSSTMTEDRNTNEYSSTTSPSKGKGSKRVGNKKAEAQESEVSEAQGSEVSEQSELSEPSEAQARFDEGGRTHRSAPTEGAGVSQQPTANSQEHDEGDMLAGDAVEVAERLLEMCDGDRDMARNVVTGAIDNLKASRRKAARKLSSKGLSAAEYMDRLKAQKGELAEIDAELQRLNDVIGFVGSVGYRSSEEVGSDAPSVSESDGVSLEGVNPNADETVNPPAVQRALGYKILRGDATLRRIYRQKPEEVSRAEGAATEVRFSSTVTCKGRYAVIPRSQLQPSHVVSSAERNDRTNPMHFIPEAQPKEDRQKASSVASAYAIARSIRPEEITGAVTAYVGAPNVNERGEVIQGNNRSIALKLLAGAEKEKYEAYLRAHLAEFGIDEAEFDAIEDPVLVNMLPVGDEVAIRLGQLTQSDTESATGRRVTSDVSKRMSEAQYGRFMSLLLGSVDDVESDISESVESGAKAALEYLYGEGVINTDEYSNSLREDGGVRSSVVRSFEDIVYGVLEEGATVAVRDALRRLPSDLRKSLVLVLVQDRMLPKEKRLVGDVQQAVLGMYQLYDGKPFSGRLRDEAVARLRFLLGTPSLFDQSKGEVVPYKLFNAGAVELMKLLLRGDAALVRSSLMDYYSYARGAQNLFVDTPALDKEEAYKKVFPEYGEIHRQLEERDGEGSASSSVGGVVSKGSNDQGENAYLSEAQAQGSEVSEGIGADRSESEAQSGFDGDGRTDRASLQRATREGASLQRATREGEESELKPVIDQDQDDGRREDGDDAREGGANQEGSLPEQSRGDDVASGVSTLSNGGDTEGSSEGASGASDGVGTRGLLGSSEAEQGGDTPVGVPESAESSDEGLHTEGYRGSSRSDSEAERGDDAVGGSEHESRSGHGVVGRSAGQEDSGAGAGSSATSDGRGSRSVDDNKRYSNAEIAELVSSVTDVVDGLVVLTGAVTDELRRAVSGYRSGGVAKSGRGVLDEYYTPRGVVSFVKRVLDGLPEIGDAKRPALILEPSVGVGNFLDGIPKLANRSALIRAYEVNEISARIAKVLHPEANVRIAPFESLFMDERGGKRKPESMGEYDLVLGNPPYGDHRGKYRGLGEEPSIARYEDYFVKRSLDLLREGGVLAMVLPSGWLNRNKVERGWRIEVAYRLPNGVFAGTDVGTDVVVLRKDSKYKGDGSHNYFESHPDHVLGELGTRKNRYGREEEYVAWSDKSEVLQEAEGAPRSEVSEPSEAPVSEVSEQSELSEEAQSGRTTTDAQIERPYSGLPEGGGMAEEKGKSKGKEKGKSKGKRKRKGSGLPKIKRGQIKYTLSKGDEVINASDQFLKRFTEEEMSAFADCDLGGYLAHPAAHPSVACYVGDGRWMHRFYYCSGNIYGRLENLERLYASGQIEENQYLGQKALLEAVLPSYKDLGHIYLTPNVEFVKSLILPAVGDMGAVGGVSLKERFLGYVEELPYDAFGRSSRWEVRSYIENRPVRGGDKAENAAERRRRKEVGDRLFREFLEHELTEDEQQEVERKFNRAYNGTYTPDYTGVPMFSQINKNFHGKPLQLTSVQLAGVGRMSMRGVGVLAHEVGFGKTLSGVLSAHEAMTRGHAKRPLIVCPNDSILEQWVETIYEALPEAKINVLGNLGASYDLTDFSVGEGEITLVTYEGLKRMGFRDETYDRMAGEFTYIQEDLKTHQSSARDREKKRAKVDRLVGRMMRGARQEYSFEDLGFDYMVFDEVHNANHIVGKVRLDKNVASDFRGQSQRTSDLGIKTWLAAQWIQSQNGGRNVVLLSATPFTNKPLEYYSVLSLVANDRLKELGFYRVEQFFETFMEAEPDLEIGADGSVTERMAVRRFKNNAVFNNLLREFVDVKGVEDNPNLVRPERHVKEYKVPQNDMTRDAMTALSVMLTDDKQKLAGIGHARLIAFSPFASGASGFTARNYKEFVEGSPKLLATMRLVAESKRGNDSSGQLIYSELGIEYFDLLREYLIREVGYKEDEVVILSGKTSISERGRIQKGFNDGQIKVVLGSPAIKEGVNLQRNATDLYILSLPWNFTQLIQVEGRCWRQGNQWHHLRVNYMLTEDSADVFMLQKLQTKQRLYEEAMRADADIVDVGDIDAEELKMDLIRDPKSRASFATAEKRKELQHERETLVAEQSVLSDALTTYNESQSRADSMESRLVANMGRYSSWEVSSQKNLIKKERDKADRAKARLERKVGDVDRAEGRISDLTRDIADVDKRLEGLEQYYDDLVVSYAELEQSRQANRSFDEVVGGFVEERKQENSGDFYTKFTDEELNKRVRYRREAAGEEELSGIKSRALRDGVFMKAPNGKATRLSERQWLEVRTGAFKSWFGDWELPYKEVEVVSGSVDHGFKNLREAREWAKGNIARVYSSEETGGKGSILISRSAIDKYLSESAIAKSSSMNAHLSVLKVLPSVIRTGVDAEQHLDYLKGTDNIRDPRNGVREGVMIHRVYGAVSIGDNTYRVKVTLKVYDDASRHVKPHSYEATKIELLDESNSSIKGEPLKGRLVGVKDSNPSNSSSLSVAKLLKGIEKSYEPGKYLLDDYSKVVDENGEPMVVYHQTGSDFTVFDLNQARRSSDVQGFYFSSGVEDWSAMGDRTIGAYLNIRHPLLEKPLVDMSQDEGGVAAREDILHRGYDGIISSEEDMETEYVVFDSRQIKSATDNAGSFDSKNPDIRFRRVGAGETASDVVERGVRKRRYRRRREADRELMGRKLSPTERAFVGRMERLRERYGQSVSLDAGGTMWGLSGVMDNSLVQRRERVKTEWVDATNPIRVYEERVGALSGRPVEGSRSVWMRYNQTSSRATSKIEELEGGVYRELAQKLREVSRELGLTGEQLDDYLFAKHAPERNAYMRRRGVEQRLAKLDAKHADDEGWLDSSERRKAEAKYKAKEAELEYAYETQLGEDIPVHFAGHELFDGVEGAQDLVERFEEAMRSRGLSVEELWEAVRAVNDAILVVWRDCGMMSQEAYEAVSGMYEWYVPMQGFAEESRGDYEYMHDHVGGFVQPIQRAKGRVSRPDRPLLAMYRKIRSAVIGGYHNVEKQAFYGLVSNYPSDYTSLGRQYYSVGEDGLLTPLYPSSFASEDIEEFEDRMREGLADGTVTLIRERGARVAYLTDPRSLGEHVVKVMIGGREHLVFVNGRPELAQAVNRINVGEDTDVERFAKGLLRGMAQNVTSRNPNFMIVNLLRDAQMSLAVNFLKRGGVYTRAYMRNYLRVTPLVLGRIWGKGHTGVGVSSDVEAYWEEFKRFGGQTGYARLLSEHKARRRVNSLLDAGGKARAVRVGEDVLNIFARPNEMIESWGRFATYVTSREMGRSVTESISDAKEVSVNFNRKGAGRSGLYRLIGACQMFFNAGVQGMNLAYGVAVENPWGSSAVVASLMVLGYAVAALQDGDDDHGDVYRAINPAVRKSNVCFVVDKDSYVKVPLAIEMRAFYGMGQELYGLVSGKQDAVEAVLGSMDSMGEIVAYNPTNGASPLAGMVEGQRRGESVGSSLYRGGRGFVPAQIQPITDLLANQNFYGGALRWESRYVDRSLPLYKRLPKHTPEWQVSVSKWINGIGQDKYVSEWRHGVLSPLSDPLVYSYLCSQYFGGIVQMLDQVDRAVAADGVRGAVSASPVTNRFYRYDDSLRGRGIEERFWELRREVESRSKVQRGMRESLEGARSMREYDARSRSIVEYGKGVDYEMLEGWFKDFDKLYKEYKSHRGMLTDEEDRAWRGELQQVEAEMYSEIKGYMLAVGVAR